MLFDMEGRPFSGISLLEDNAAPVFDLNGAALTSTRSEFDNTSLVFALKKEPFYQNLIWRGVAHPGNSPLKGNTALVFDLKGGRPWKLPPK